MILVLDGDYGNMKFVRILPQVNLLYAVTQLQSCGSGIFSSDPDLTNIKTNFNSPPLHPSWIRIHNPGLKYMYSLIDGLIICMGRTYVMCFDPLQ